MKVYLDACCLNRPYDDQTQDRIHLESEAVLTVLKHIEAGDWEWVVSSVILFARSQAPAWECGFGKPQPRVVKRLYRLPTRKEPFLNGMI